ncbi:MAG TPA: PA14 domain-containing protein [Candidatus Acidoferrales bacterium]|nr:PA14 domain-containing protein [Candidatus Acidoferrales bacterium]
MRGWKQTLCMIALGVAVTMGIAAPAFADSTMLGTYYVLSPGDPDASGPCCWTRNDVIQPKLGPDGLPVIASSVAGVQWTPGHLYFSDVNASGEILWWSTINAGSTFAKTEIDSLPFGFTNLFPNGTDDAHGSFVADWTGTINLGADTSVTFNVASDDDAFLFVDGNLVIDDAGIHALVPVPPATIDLGPGSHTVNLFYADREPVRADLSFSSSVPISASTPEGSAGGLMALGIALLFGACWLRKPARLARSSRA